MRLDDPPHTLGIGHGKQPHALGQRDLGGELGGIGEAINDEQRFLRLRAAP